MQAHALLWPPWGCPWAHPARPPRRQCLCPASAPHHTCTQRPLPQPQPHRQSPDGCADRLVRGQQDGGLPPSCCSATSPSALCAGKRRQRGRGWRMAPAFVQLWMPALKFGSAACPACLCSAHGTSANEHRTLLPTHTAPVPQGPWCRHPVRPPWPAYAGHRWTACAGRGGHAACVRHGAVPPTPTHPHPACAPLRTAAPGSRSRLDPLHQVHLHRLARQAASRTRRYKATCSAGPSVSLAPRCLQPAGRCYGCWRLPCRVEALFGCVLPLPLPAGRVTVQSSSQRPACPCLPMHSAPCGFLVSYYATCLPWSCSPVPCDAQHSRPSTFRPSHCSSLVAWDRRWNVKRTAADSGENQSVVQSTGRPAAAGGEAGCREEQN